MEAGRLGLTSTSLLLGIPLGPSPISGEPDGIIVGVHLPPGAFHPWSVGVQASSLVLSEGHCPVRQMRGELELASHLVVQQPATVDHVPAQ